MVAAISDLERTFRRAPRRRDVFLMLASLSEASPNALARACGMGSTRVKWIMYGQWPYYRDALGLISLGLAEEIRTPNGKAYRITSLGRRKARQLTSRAVRREVARRAVRAHVVGRLDERTSSSS